MPRSLPSASLGYPELVITRPDSALVGYSLLYGADSAKRSVRWMSADAKCRAWCGPSTTHWIAGEIISGAFGTVKDVAEAAAKALGEDKVKKEEGEDPTAT